MDNAQKFLVELALGGGGGVLTYLVARYLFDEGNRYARIQALSPNGKRNLVYLLALFAAGIPYLLGIWQRYFELTPDTLLAMFGTAFAVSQKMHGSLELNAPPKPLGELPLIVKPRPDSGPAVPMGAYPPIETLTDLAAKRPPRPEAKPPAVETHL